MYQHYCIPDAPTPTTSCHKRGAPVRATQPGNHCLLKTFSITVQVQLLGLQFSVAISNNQQGPGAVPANFHRMYNKSHPVNGNPAKDQS